MRQDGEILHELQERMMGLQRDSFLEDKLNKDVNSRKRQLYRGITALLLVFVLVGIVAWLVVGHGGHGKTSPESETFNITECYANISSQPTEKFSRLRSTLVAERTSLIDAVDAPGNIARVALCWLAHSDSFEVQFVDDVVPRFALATIYFHFAGIDQGFQNGLIRSNWLSAVHICEWDFTTCDVNGVRELSLRSLELYGPIPTYLSLLTALAALDLSTNQLSGTIPLELFNLTQMRELNILGNLITGTLPNAIGDLISLERLVIGSNALSGTLPDLRRLANLTTFYLDNNADLTGMFPNMSAATKLRHLQVESVSLAGVVPSYIWSFSDMIDISVAFTEQRGKMPTEVSSMTNLQRLELRNTKLSGSIPTEIGLLSRLTRLELVSLPFVTGTLPSELGLLSKLEELRLSWLPGVSGTIPTELCSLRNMSLRSFLVSSDWAQCAASFRKCLCCTQW